MNKHIRSIVNQNQNEFFDAFKRKMDEITNEMVDLRHKAKTETVKAKMDEKVVTMEKERDWFRDEAL